MLQSLLTAPQACSGGSHPWKHLLPPLAAQPPVLDGRACNVALSTAALSTAACSTRMARWPTASGRPLRCAASQPTCPAGQPCNCPPACVTTRRLGGMASHLPAILPAIRFACLPARFLACQCDLSLSTPPSSCCLHGFLHCSTSTTAACPMMAKAIPAVGGSQVRHLLVSFDSGTGPPVLPP